MADNSLDSDKHNLVAPGPNLTQESPLSGRVDPVTLGQQSVHCVQSKANHTPRSRFDRKWASLGSVTDAFFMPKVNSTETKNRQHVRRLVDSRKFQLFIAFAITANALEMGASVELRSADWVRIFFITEHGFTAIFFIEMLLKVFVMRALYFQTRLNQVDFFLAISGMVESWVLPVLFNKSSYFSHWEVIRLMRLLRLVRLVQVQRQLMVVVQGITASLSSMLWVGMLLALVIYGSGIFCVVVFRGDAHVTSFISLWTSMLALFNVVLLDGWGVLIWEIASSKPFLVPLFMLFVLFTSCGVINVIIGIIVDSTMTASRNFELQNRELRTTRKLKRVQELAQVMKLIDVDDSHYLSQAEILSAVEHPEFTELLFELELPKGFTAVDLFRILDTDFRSSVSQAQFVNGMYNILNNDASQHYIMMQLSMAQIKEMIQGVRDELQHTMRIGFQEVLSQLTERVQIPSVTSRADEQCQDTHLLAPKDLGDLSLVDQLSFRIPGNVFVHPDLELSRKGAEDGIALENASAAIHSLQMKTFNQGFASRALNRVPGTTQDSGARSSAQASSHLNQNTVDQEVGATMDKRASHDQVVYKQGYCVLPITNKRTGASGCTPDSALQAV